MDPNTALAMMLRWANRAIEDPESSVHDIDQAERILALDEWIANGGFLPTRWVQPLSRQPG